MDILEELEIYKASKLQNDRMLNDKLAYKTNVLFNTMMRRISETAERQQQQQQQ